MAIRIFMFVLIYDQFIIQLAYFFDFDILKKYESR